MPLPQIVKNPDGSERFQTSLETIDSLIPEGHRGFSNEKITDIRNELRNAAKKDDFTTFQNVLKTAGFNQTYAEQATAAVHPILRFEKNPTAQIKSEIKDLMVGSDTADIDRLQYTTDRITQLQNLQPKSGGFNWDNFKNKVRKIYQDAGYTDIEARVQQDVDSLFNLGGSNAEKTFEPKDWIPSVGNFKDKILSSYNEEKGTKTTEKLDFSVEQKTVGGLLTGRKTAAEKEGVIEDYLAKLPAQLQESRGKFMAGETERAVQEFGQYVPRAEEELNVSGRLFGGGLPTFLGEAAADISGALESSQIELESQDNQFYMDAAYRNQLRKSLESVTDYRTALESERGKVFTERGQQFKASQSALDRQLNQSLRTDEYERVLNTQRQRLQSAKTERESRERSSLFRNVATSAATITAAAVGGPPAAIATNTIANSIG